MKEYFEFDTQIAEDGTITVPEEFRERANHGKSLHVTVTAQAPWRPMRDDEDAIAYYLDYPVIIPGVKAPSREELYAGR